MKLSQKAGKDIKVVAVLVAAGTVFGIGFSSAMTGDFNMKTIVVGGYVGFLVSFLCAAGNFGFLTVFERLPFTVILLIKSTYFAVVTTAVVWTRYLFLGEYLKARPLTARLLVIILATTLVFSFFANFVFMLRRMLGPNVLLNFFSGRYHHPREEERIFMFLDIVSSTTIAEKIGHVKFHMLLNDFFYDLSDPILGAKGEIYKYVGDEVIVSWNLAEGLKDSRCIRVFFDIGERMAERSNHYLQKFGFVPRYRVGIHCGRVVVGEMGDYKREIAFLGDTVNTTARIQGATKKYDKDLLVSSEVIEKLKLPETYQVEELGSIQLRGKEEKTGIFSVSRIQY